MIDFTENTKLSEIEILRPCLKYLLYKCDSEKYFDTKMSLGEMHEKQPSWNIESIIRGLKHLCENMEKQKTMYKVYTPSECEDDPEKDDVRVFYLPADKNAVQADQKKPFVLLIAGGAYAFVCSMAESLPAAVRLNELGYNTFILNYRVLRNPLFPLPFEDIASALRFILKNKEQFGITDDSYIINGYSAGGNAGAVWGTEKNGWAKYGLPKPRAMWLGYPAIFYDYLHEDKKDWFLEMMFGKNFNMETMRAYDISETFTKNYPPCYLVHAKDDQTVPYRHSIDLKKMLDKYHIPAEMELVEHGGHGWGDGSGTDAAGWIDRAVAFIEKI